MSAADIQTQRAKTLLAHYLKFGLEAANYRWNSDNAAEVDDIVDSIIDAAAQPTQPAQPDAKSEWIELRDGGWVRSSDIYRIHIARNGDLIAYLRHQDDGLVVGADDPGLGDFLFAVGIYTDR